MISPRELHRIIEREGGYVNRRDYACDLGKIVFPQTVCPGCGFLGSLLYRQCRCPTEMLTVESLDRYRALIAALPKTEPAPLRPRRKESVVQRAARRRTKILRAKV
jgi:hypothetical protein